MAQLLPMRPDPMIPMWAEDEEAMSVWKKLKVSKKFNAGKADPHVRGGQRGHVWSEKFLTSLTLIVLQIYMLSSPRNRLGYNSATNFQCCIPVLRVSRRSSVSGECPGLPATMVYKPPHATSAVCSTFAITSGHICFWFRFRFYQRSPWLSHEDIFCVSSLQMKSK